MSGRSRDGASGPRSKRLLLGPGHKPPRKNGCPLTALTVMTLIALAGWAGGAFWGWVS